MQIVVKHDNKDYTLELREPNFDQLALAYNALISGYGPDGNKMPNTTKAGKILIDLCGDSDKSSKEFFALPLGPKLMLAASIQAAQMVEIFDAELKKN